MKVLILNWRDIKNPQSGGAEILTHEIAKRLVKKGHSVTLFCSKYPGARDSEVLDGVKIIRQGYPDARLLLSAVHYKAFKFYRSKMMGKVDLVIDEIHGVPFFTPLYVKEKKVALICEMAGDLWDLAVHFPFNIFGKLLEAIYPVLYNNTKVITISESSKEGIVKAGFNKKLVSVVHPGSDAPVVNVMPKKDAIPTAIFIARLSKAKGVEDAIDAVSVIKKTIPKIRLWILGRGPEDYVEFINTKIKNLELSDNVKLKGFTSEKEKIDLLTRAHVLICSSAKEGWGLTVHEAGARGTPSVVYDVDGLREVVKNGINGIICQENSYEEIAINVVRILRDKKLYMKLQKGAILERRKYTWDRAVNEVLEVIKR